jgi:hypothetical protein
MVTHCAAGPAKTLLPCDVMKKLRIVLLTITAVAAVTSAMSSAANARCLRDCRAYPSVRNQWGYGGLVRTWGLGGPADAPWVGGAITGATPYGRYPYDRVRGL